MNTILLPAAPFLACDSTPLKPVMCPGPVRCDSRAINCTAITCYMLDLLISSLSASMALPKRLKIAYTVRVLLVWSGQQG